MNLPEALQAELESGVRIPHTFRGILQLFNNDNATVAAALAGTDNKKSRDYKNQLRNVERWRHGRRNRAGKLVKSNPSRQKLNQLRAIAAKKKLAPKYNRLRRHGARVTISGTVLVSADERDRDISDVEFSPADTKPWVNAAEQGDWELCADLFEDAFYRSYDYVDISFADVSAIKIRPRK